MVNPPRLIKSYNKFLRQSAQEETLMTISTLSVSELLSVLEQIQMFVKGMNTGKEKTEILPMTISLHLEDSKGMSL